MAAELPSEIVVAICLHFAEAETSTSMDEIIRRVEAWQIRKDRHFGISQSDFRGAFADLASGMGLSPYTEYPHGFQRLLERTPLRDWLSAMLAHRDAYFNDEGEYWTPEYGTPTSVVKLTMQEFFSNEPPEPNAISSMLKRYGLATTDVLDHHSRPGCSS